MSALAALAEAGRLSERVELAPMTTYKVGGAARWFMEADREEDLADLAAALREDPAPVLVLGRGSNVVVADGGFEGVVVHLGRGMAGLDLQDGGIAAAGAALPQPALARATAAAGRGGLEFMVGIPGSVGGAVRMNAGCFGSETADWLLTARVVDLGTATASDRTPGDLGLRYRHSELGPAEVVVSGRFRTVERPEAECRERLREITRWRKDHQPGGTLNAGSVFKNPEGDHAGRIIDELGLKGLRVGGASVSERHANFFEADRGTSAQDVHDLVALVRRRVRDAAGIDLEPELRFVGDFGGSR
ncbi:MAG: UDP-N-acetylmuramate dehydrogenase [Actinobacteria bacterium]|nr:UDP-N-acetylmuramate dehydrogenase [Actinomycetota bacterium]